MTGKKVAIIGAGIAGISAGLLLHAAGMDVRLFDKGRSPGGRVSTRRVPITGPGGEAQALLFDHGAQFVRACAPGLLNWLKQQAGGGAVQKWVMDGDADEDGARFIGTPGMSALPRALAEGLAVETSHLVSAIHRQKDQWRLEFDESGVKRLSSPFDFLIIAIPAPQAAKLTATIFEDARAMAESATYSPCWAGLFAAPRDSFDSLRSGPVDGDAIVAWICRRQDRHPADDGGGELDSIVVHASADWSRDNLEKEPNDIVRILRDSLAAYGSRDVAPAYEAAHRWRYAVVDRPADKTCLWYDDLMLGLCGDWLHGPTIESAWISGQAVAREIIKTQ